VGTGEEPDLRDADLGEGLVHVHFPGRHGREDETSQPAVPPPTALRQKSGTGRGQHEKHRRGDLDRPGLGQRPQDLHIGKLQHGDRDTGAGKKHKTHRPYVGVSDETDHAIPCRCTAGACPSDSETGSDSSRTFVVSEAGKFQGLENSHRRFPVIGNAMWPDG
jgi:hypothetical protein